MTLALRQVTKRYGGVTVLDHVDLTVENGEIHALLGANGAGKSTLIKCVSGAIAPDEGEIDISGKLFTSLTPRQAQAEGVAVIYQELSVVNTLSVADNLFLGDERTKMGFTQRKLQRREVREWLDNLGIELDPKTLLSNVSTAELQVVEIAKALRRNPEVLILDEPTAALSEKEVTRLGKQMQELKARGLPLLFITHRISEVFEWADRVTVLHGGRVVLTCRVSDSDQKQVVAAITQKEADEDAGRACDGSHVGEEVALRVRSLVGPGIGPVDFDVHECEVVGVYGLVGSGRTELTEALFGAWPIESGTVEVGGFAVKARSPEDAIAAGVALVPSDRLRKSLFLELAAYENVLFPSFGRLAHGHFWRNRAKERASFERGAQQVNLQPPSPKLEARRFSGGNQQKLILSRLLQMEEGCRLMLLDEPTQGVDVGARSELYRAVREFAQAGRGVLITSNEPELMQLADRVIVLSRGRVVGVLEHGEITETAMVRLAHFGETTADESQGDFGVPGGTHMSSIIDMAKGKPLGASSRGAGGGSAARVQVILANVLVVGLIGLIVFFSIRSPQFLTWVNVKVLLVNQAPLAVVVVVFTMLLIAGYIDLSVGSISAAAGLACSLLVVNADVPRGVAILGGIALGMGAGALNGYLCAILKFNPIVVTLGMVSLIRGTALLFHQEQVFGLGGIFQKIAAGTIVGLPVLIWFVVIAFILGGVFIAWTPWGRHIFAIGANRQAAYLSGLSVKWLPFWLYVATGAAAAVTGILMSARLDGMTPGNAGLGLEMQVLTVVLLGGVAFAGGRGSLFGVLIAWLFLAVLQDGLVLLNASPYVQLVASGAALVLAAAIDTLGGVLTNRMQQKKRTQTQLEQTTPVGAE